MFGGLASARDQGQLLSSAVASSPIATKGCRLVQCDLRLQPCDEQGEKSFPIR